MLLFFVLIANPNYKPAPFFISDVKPVLQGKHIDNAFGYEFDAHARMTKRKCSCPVFGNCYSEHTAIEFSLVNRRQLFFWGGFFLFLIVISIVTYLLCFSISTIKKHSSNYANAYKIAICNLTPFYA